MQLLAAQTTLEPQPHRVSRAGRGAVSEPEHPKATAADSRASPPRSAPEDPRSPGSQRRSKQVAESELAGGGNFAPAERHRMTGYGVVFGECRGATAWMTGCGVLVWRTAVLAKPAAVKSCRHSGFGAFLAACHGQYRQVDHLGQVRGVAGWHHELGYQQPCAAAAGGGDCPGCAGAQGRASRAARGIGGSRRRRRAPMRKVACHAAGPAFDATFSESLDSIGDDSAEVSQFPARPASRAGIPLWFQHPPHPWLLRRTRA
jgi:hypothetical protein